MFEMPNLLSHKGTQRIAQNNIRVKSEITNIQRESGKNSSKSNLAAITVLPALLLN